MSDFNKTFGEFIEICKQVLHLYEENVGNLVGDTLLKNLTSLSKLNINDTTTHKIKSCFEYIYIENDVKNKLKSFRKWIYEDDKIVMLEFGRIKKINGKFKFKKQTDESNFIFLNLSEIYSRILQLTKIFGVENNKDYEKYYKNCLYKLFKYSCENEEDVKLIDEYLTESNKSTQNDVNSMLSKDNIENFKKIIPELLQGIGSQIPGGLDGLNQSGLDINKLIDGVCSTLQNTDIQNDLGKTMEEAPKEAGISGIMNSMMKMISDGKIIKSIAKSMDLPEQDISQESLQEDMKKASGMVENFIPMIANGNTSDIQKELKNVIQTQMSTVGTSSIGTSSTEISTEPQEEEDDYEVS